MAQRVQIQLEDDLDGSPADETVRFALDGTSYEIDLSAKNAAKLRTAVERYAVAGRRVSPRRGRSRSRQGGPRTSDIRAWARSSGYDVSDRGRVSAEVRAAYDAAH